ncbi:hypothetical protein LXL04_007939 [Taraxacum kok-saghyz]
MSSSQVLLMDNMVDMLSNVKLQPTKILTAICGLLHTLKSNKGTKEKNLSHSISEQGFEMGIALPSFLLNIEVASGGIVLRWIVGVCLSFKIFKVYWKLKNIKQEHAKFWKQHPALVKAHLTPELQHDFKRVVELASRLLQELMKATVLDPADYTGLEAALDNHKVSLYFTESPTNPFLRCVDIELVSKMCHEKGAIVCIDGTFATPLNQKALALGADIVFYSATKWQ